MPSLDFKGKSFIYTHHLGVPYRELIVDAGKSSPAPGRQPDLDDNLILHGDNLDALKALLPRYAGRVDCIYIDPPYNTGTEGWCYNDKVNSPLMREWLKKEGNPVEREDLQRHDKWLCMMWPRLQLLKELLAEHGAIFVSIDDNEVHRLRAMMDEVFGEENFVASIVWQRRISPEARLDLGAAHDYIIAFAKTADALRLKKLPLSDLQEQSFKNPDNDPKGAWVSSDFTAQGFRPNQMYKIKSPGGEAYEPPPGRCWGNIEREYEKLKADGRMWFGADGKARPRVKTYLNESGGVSCWTWWTNSEVGDNQESKKEVNEILGSSTSFDFPKPSRLIKRILEIATDKDSLILDSFAGSGTTAHAVLALNAKDGGNRKFILCETEAYADTLTAERVRRVIHGYEFTGTHQMDLMDPVKVTWTTFGKDKQRNEILERIAGIKTLEGASYDKIETKITDGVLTVVGQKQVKEKMPGLGGSFTYVELGEAMDLDRLLAETPGTVPGFASLARYLFFTATGHTLGVEGMDLMDLDGPVLIGETAVWRIYLHYRADEGWLRSPAAAFTRTQAEAIATESKASGKQVLVFAAAKYISHRGLKELHGDTKVRVDFAQLPYALHRVQEG